MTSITIDTTNTNKGKYEKKNVLDVLNDDCLTNQHYCSIEHKELTNRIKKHFLPHLNKKCHIPLVNWCEKEIKYKKSPNPVGFKDQYLIKLDSCLSSSGCFTLEQEYIYQDKKSLYGIYEKKD